jgi:two-component system cell cycle sensor histidine kinase/response regulator CckA
MVLSLTKSRSQAIALANTTLDLEKANIELRKEIAERKQVEEALKKSEELHKEAQHVAQIGHWELNSPSGTPVWSEEIFHIFGLDPKKSEPSFAAHVNIIHDEDWSLLDNSIQELSTNGTPFDIEFRIQRSNGETRWMHARGSAVKSEYGITTRMFGTAQDITERKRMEEELLRAQKLESVGLLAGGIAHDFNNILTIIMGNISLAKTDLARGDDPSELLTEAERASKRAQTLTRQLLTFAKGGAPLKETASIKDILKESSSFVLRGSKSGCEFSLAEDLWPAEVDVGQISQVINNIVINANQAMPKGGIIQIAAENLIIGNGQGLPVKAGKYVRISIKDQGVGIAEKHLLNIFDPYFTTKQEGSGLGLATTYSIIRKHDGHITVESKLGEGTTFHIYLPASDKAVPEKEEIKLIKGQGRILVMDDEVALKRMIGRMLRKLGYESEFAKDGAEAIEMYKGAMESRMPYDAVILDLTIPGGMGGKEAIKELLEIDPEVKAIVSSGYSDDQVLSNFREYGFKGMMPKPFESRSLGKVLHEVLEGKGKD